MSEGQCIRLNAWICRICGQGKTYKDDSDYEAQVIEHFGTEHPDAMREMLR